MAVSQETSASSRTATTKSSTMSPGISDDDRSFEPNSETDLTEPEYLPSLTQKAKQRKIRRVPASSHLQADSAEIRASETENVTNTSAVELVHRGCYKDPADDIDEDLSKVPEDYGRSDNTWKLNLRLKDRWAWYCRTKAIELSADLKWEDSEDALRQASLNDMHWFLNYNKIGVVGMRHLIDKCGLDKQPRANTPVYIEDMQIILCLYNTIRLFTHLQISLQRDLHGGPPVLMIEIKPQFVKSVLGMYKVNTFALPEIVYGILLVFSPHVLLFIILFYEMLIPLKRVMDNYYVFPKVAVVDGKPCIFEIHGFLNALFSHQFHYRTRELLNESGFVSDAQRNEIVCGLNLVKEFLRAVKWMSCWIDTRRPRYLTDMEKASVEKDLDWKQVVIDIERQLTGGAVNDKPACEVLQQEFAMPPEHILLVESFFTWPTSDSLEDEWARRNKAMMVGPLRGRLKHPASEDEELIVDPPSKKQKGPKLPTISAWEKKLDTIKEKVAAVKPSACFQCLKEYTDVYGVKRHFKASHLQDRKCNFCDLLLQHEMHLRLHAEEVHRLRT
ncbi:uncharacterized protein P174DRAFT_509439 [Aspergillus novofumigatus IBT 16806]|uniref:C2H2-type domain-containing protein n=1 Tax=Aspergillus novofumigatus (strain IBT 16806) TaxID=1392255 RepID=A0A2I1CPI8_ASPN1|nr:uncharacterized protein P174DRAFT_509439 [Aspergillus novofumigatus IBT 16806]PKX99523.1 hypothetical protein P174DRAFT_509439 [Aspergillus novofumigatus IBT 16806]